MKPSDHMYRLVRIGWSHCIDADSHGLATAFTHGLTNVQYGCSFHSETCGTRSNAFAG